MEVGFFTTGEMWDDVLKIQIRERFLESLGGGVGVKLAINYDCGMKKLNTSDSITGVDTEEKKLSNTVTKTLS